MCVYSTVAILSNKALPRAVFHPRRHPWSSPSLRKATKLLKRGKRIPSRSKSEILNSGITLSHQILREVAGTAELQGHRGSESPWGRAMGLGTRRMTRFQLSRSVVGSAMVKGTVWVERDGRAMPYCLEGRAKGRVEGRYVNIRTPNMSNLVKSGQENQAVRRTDS